MTKPNEKPTENPLIEPKQVLIPQDQLDALMALPKQVEALQKQVDKGNKTSIVNKQVDEHYARIRVFEGLYVIGFEGQNFIEQDAKGNDIELVKIRLLDIKTKKEVVKEVNYVDFIADTPREKVLILKHHIQKTQEGDGQIEVTKIKGNNTVGTGFYADVINIVELNTYDLQLKNDEKLTVSEKVMNI